MSDQSVQPVHVERRGAVATVSMQRPEAHNALDTALKVALRDALAEVAADADVRVVVLTGSGKAFCVGQDLAEHAAALEDGGGSALSTVAEHFSPITTALATMPKPVVAAVNGTCVGAGLGFALACDLRVLADGATLGTAFTGIGLTCDSGLAATLAASVGAARARELVLLARTFDPAQAVAWGIAGEVVPAAEVAETAAALADRLAAGPTRAYAESKRLLDLAGTAPLAEVLAAEGEAQARLGDTDDHRGAVAAFLAREKPTFTGR